MAAPNSRERRNIVFKHITLYSADAWLRPYAGYHIMDDPTSSLALNQEVHLVGTVQKIVFYAPQSGFSVLQVVVDDAHASIPVVGYSAHMSTGGKIECIGCWKQDRRYGRQFNARELRIAPPQTLEGIEKYLGSGLIEGIGPQFAKRLVHHFGERVLDVIENEPEQLEKIPGIGRKRLAAVTRAWKSQIAVKEIMVFLHSHGMGSARAVRIYRRYGNDAVRKISENPYCLTTDLYGFGFRTADGLARNLGLTMDSPMRIAAGIDHILRERAQRGHCACAEEDLIKMAGDLLEVDENRVIRCIEEGNQGGTIVVDTMDGTRSVYLRELFDSETGVASHLRRLCLRAPGHWTSSALSAFQRHLPNAQPKLTNGQRHAIETVLKSKVSIITGGPGVGKTTVLNALLRSILHSNTRVALCAPTGRAAKRLAEATGHEAKTLHRLLEFDPQSYEFRHNQNHPLAFDCVVLDEASMVDIRLMYFLLRALPDKTSLAIVGDADQLPAVGPGAVLADLIASDVVPVVRLKEIFRQSAQSYITVNAHRIQQGQMPQTINDSKSDFFLVRANDNQDIADKTIELVSERIPQRFGLNGLLEIQVLTPMNRGALGTEALNHLLQARLNPQSKTGVVLGGTRFATGDKVIQVKNDYEKEVFNGDIGRIVSISREPLVFTIDYDGRAIEYMVDEMENVKLAYATTIHKAQGCEYPAVVIPLTTQHFPLLQRDLLYTAITRGKRLVVIVGQPKAIAIAVHNDASNDRMTRLRERLANALSKVNFVDQIGK